MARKERERSQSMVATAVSVTGETIQLSTAGVKSRRDFPPSSMLMHPGTGEMVGGDGEQKGVERREEERKVGAREHLHVVMHVQPKPIHPITADRSLQRNRKMSIDGEGTLTASGYVIGSLSPEFPCFISAFRLNLPLVPRLFKRVFHLVTWRAS